MKTHLNQEWLKMEMRSAMGVETVVVSYEMYVIRDYKSVNLSATYGRLRTELR